MRLDGREGEPLAELGLAGVSQQAIAVGGSGQVGPGHSHPPQLAEISLDYLHSGVKVEKGRKEKGLEVKGGEGRKETRPGFVSLSRETSCLAMPELSRWKEKAPKETRETASR